MATAERQGAITEQTKADSNRSVEAIEQKQEIKNESYECVARVYVCVSVCANGQHQKTLLRRPKRKVFNSI